MRRRSGLYLSLVAWGRSGGLGSRGNVGCCFASACIHVLGESPQSSFGYCLLDELDRLIMSVYIHPFKDRVAAPSKNMASSVLCFATKRAVIIRGGAGAGTVRAFISVRQFPSP